MSTLKYAILGLLHRKSLTGYDLKKEFDRELANFWYAKHSQIYPELKKLTEDGLVTFEITITGEKLEKKLYSITEKGRETFEHWISEEVELEPTPKDLFRLKAYFIDATDKETILAHFSDQLRQRRKKLNILRNKLKKHPYYDEVGDIFSAMYGDYIVLKGAVMREQTYVKWLLQCIREIEHA